MNSRNILSSEHSATAGSEAVALGTVFLAVAKAAVDLSVGRVAAWEGGIRGSYTHVEESISSVFRHMFLHLMYLLKYNNSLLNPTKLIFNPIFF